MKTQTIIGTFVTAVLLAGCGTFNNIDEDHNKQCKENCNVITGSTEPPTVIVQTPPVVVQPTEPVIIEKPVLVAPQAVSAPSPRPQINRLDAENRRHGLWITTDQHGTKTTATYRHGLMEGIVTHHFSDGSVTEIPMSNGVINGIVTEMFSNGNVMKTPYSNGRVSGLSTLTIPDGVSAKGKRQEDGRRVGPWTIHHNDGRVEVGHYKDESPKEIKRDGIWTITHPNGKTESGKYGECQIGYSGCSWPKHGTWTITHPDGTQTKEKWRNGNLR